ncbi:MAG: PPOX class F420-dependent oxidoreductase [Candidatus Tectomicrobia bacterium]|uniref:PPOX class F420-dependent oxidoreductase n=1 Tax=Tectimicrobiota bacterium TaxID=2528274 RepID=A0A932HXX6_UNCTE|nr:PPOX class F420-dependent oxidoreductase [Candidatus Tectomicrobia bacterium]
MNRAEALAFLQRCKHGVLATLLPDGRPHPTPVVFGLMGEAIEISMTRDRVKTRNLRRDPRATLCAFPEGSWHPYLCAEGRAELVEDPDGQRNLTLYRHIAGKDPDDLEEYLQAMKKDKRLVCRLKPERLYPIS